MGRRTHSGNNRERKDYTWLLQELQKQTPSAPVESPPSEVAVAVLEKENPFSPYRQRIMSDERIKYLYSRSERKLHDKSCPKARSIPDEELCYAEKYPTNISQCPHCAVKAYVRLGAKDFYNFPLYEKHFERMRFTPSLLRWMYVNDRMQTAASNNGLTIWGKEDSWRLEYRDDGDAMRLTHNNYRPLPDGTRVFTRGYHLQTERTTAKHALTVISGYTYEGHKAAMLRKEQARLGVCPKDPSAKQNNMRVMREKVLLAWKKFTSWLRKIFRK